MKLTQKLVIILGLIFVGITFAQAHAFLDQAEPKVGSTVKVSPQVVQIWFTKDIVPASKQAASTIAVFNTLGEEVDRKDSTIDPKDQALMTVSVLHLPAGAYKVIWSAICRDTHHTTGTFTFVVAYPD